MLAWNPMDLEHRSTTQSGAHRWHTHKSQQSLACIRTDDRSLGYLYHAKQPKLALLEENDEKDTDDRNE